VARPMGRLGRAAVGGAVAWCWWAGFLVAALWTGHLSLVAGVVVAPVVGSAVTPVRSTVALAVAAVAAVAVAGTVDGWTPLLVPMVVLGTTAAGSLAAVIASSIRAADIEALGIARRTSQRERRRRRAVEARTRLYRLAAALAATTSVEDVAETTFAALRDEVGASAALLGVLEGDIDDPDSRVRMRHAFGFRPDLFERWPSAPLAPEMPATAAMRSGAAIFADRAEQFAGQWPAVGTDVLANGTGALCVLPLMVSARPTGFLAVSWPVPRSFGEEERRSLQALADQCAQALERARLAERERRARQRLAFLGEVTRLVGASLEPADVASQVAELVVGAMADACAVIVPDDAGTPYRLAGASRSHNAALVLEQVVAELTGAHREGSPADGDEPAVPAPERDGSAHGPSVCRLPLVAAGSQLGTLVVVSGVDGPPLDAQDESLAAEVAARTSTALDNANRYERERHIASVLQRAALPDHLPEVPGVHFDAIYRAGTAGTEVGGDWYDVVPLPDGRALVSVGDVMGKGAAAAALMSQARTAIRAYGVLDPRPALVLDRIDRLMATFGATRLVSAVVAVLEPCRRRVVLAAAGHPPPLVAGPGGCRPVEEGRRRILGVPPELRRAPASGASPAADGAVRPGSPDGNGKTAPEPEEEAVVDLAADDVLILYSDGLVERRGETLSDGLRRLCAAASRQAGTPAWADQPARCLVEDVLPASVTTDDVVVLTVAMVPAAVDAVPAAVDAVPAAVDAVPAAVSGGDGGATWIILPSEPTSAGVARRWVEARLARWAAGSQTVAARCQGDRADRADRTEQLLEDGPAGWAALLTSEVVTNAVLHARTDIGVGVRIDGDVVHVEVCDQDAAAPVAKPFGPQASTGRGLLLLDRLATAWGVEERPAGKVVWFDVALTPAARRHRPPRRSTRVGSGDLQRTTPGGSLVRLLRVPVALAVETAAHYDGLARELQVRAAQPEPEGSPAAGRRWSWRSVASIGSVVSTLLLPVTQASVEALAHGTAVLDVEVACTAQAAAACRELNDVLDEIEQWCRRGWLLAVAREPITTYRRWLLGQVAAQAAGAAPEPWPAVGPQQGWSAGEARLTPPAAPRAGE